MAYTTNTLTITNAKNVTTTTEKLFEKCSIEPITIITATNSVPIMPTHFYISMIPKITDVKVLVPNKVVEVTFLDGKKEKAVCREPDVFSLETAISICISKRLMGGSGAYNKAIKRGIKVYEDKQKKEALEKAEQERIEKKRAKRKAYKKRCAEKKEQAEKEKQIEIQKEAYIRAMKEINKGE